MSKHCRILPIVANPTINPDSVWLIIPQVLQMNGSFLLQFWGSVLETSKQTNVRCPSCKPYAVHPEWGGPKVPPKLDDFRCQNKWSGCSLENSRLNIHIHVVKWTPSKHWHCAPAAAIGIMFPLSLIHTPRQEARPNPQSQASVWESSNLPPQMI